MSSSAELSELADYFASEAAAFVATVESVAAGENPGVAVTVLLLGLSDVLAAGARLAAFQDLGSGDAEAEPVPEASTTDLASALTEAIGAVDEYRELVDPYLGDEVATNRLSQDLAGICGDLLVGLARYTEDDDARRALDLWQRSYLLSWGPAAGACLRAVQSLMALIRFGDALGDAR